MIAPIVRMFRAYLSAWTCFVGGHNDDVAEFVAYFQKGSIKDVRMVNDPLTRIILGVCHDHLPHARVEWVSNTLSCSSDGHAIVTVVRELQSACPAVGSGSSSARP